MASERVGGDKPLGKLLGYADGAFVGQMLKGNKAITEKTIQKLLTIRQVADLFAWNPYAGFATAENEPLGTEYRPSHDAIQIGKVFDMIPEGDILRRLKAYTLATAAIVAVLEGHDVAATEKQAPGQKKQSV